MSMYTPHVHSPCMYTPHVHSLCTLLMYTFHVHSPCTLPMYTSYVHSQCTLPMYGSHSTVPMYSQSRSCTYNPRTQSTFKIPIVVPLLYTSLHVLVLLYTVLIIYRLFLVCTTRFIMYCRIFFITSTTPFMSRERMKIILSYYNIIKLIFMMRTTKSFIL